MAIALDFSKKSSELMLDLINSKAKRALKLDEITFATPEIVEGIGTHDTKLTISPSPTAVKLVDDAVLTYKRPSLDLMFENVTTAVFEVQPEDLTAQQFLTAVNEKYSLGLSDEDFDLAGFVIEDGVGTLVAKTDGLVYVGTLALRVTENESLRLIMGDGALDGFVAPVFEEEEVGYEVKNNHESIYVNAGGNIDFPAAPNYPATGFVSSTDGVLEMNIRASLLNAPASVPVAGLYEFTTPLTTAWTLNLYFGMADKTKKVTDLYDITLSMISTEDNITVVTAPAVVDDQGWLTFNDPSDNTGTSALPGGTNNTYFFGASLRTYNKFKVTGAVNQAYYGTFDCVVTAKPKAGGAAIVVPIKVICKRP